MRKLLLIALCALLLASPALAVDTAAVTQALPDEARGILGDVEITAGLDARPMLERTWEYVRSELGARLSEAASSAAVAAAVTLLCSLAGALAPDGRTPEYVCFGAALAVSAALPVVGKILSDAASTYLAGAELVRGAVGAVGLAAVLCVCIGPVLSLGAHYLLFKAAAAVTEPFTEGRLSGLIGDIGTAYGMTLGLVGSGGAMLFLSVVLSTEALAG